jgi:hypothetical protein
MAELPQDEDGRIELLFRKAAAPLADDGFSDRVMHRIARRAWRRRAILAAAGATGIAVAWQPLWNIAGWLSRQLVLANAELVAAGGQLAARWPELSGLLQNRYALYAAALVLVVPGIVRWLEE